MGYFLLNSVYSSHYQCITHIHTKWHDKKVIFISTHKPQSSFIKTPSPEEHPVYKLPQAKIVMSLTKQKTIA